MKYLGIDFGLKKIGLALTDARGKIAFPYGVVANDERLFSVLDTLIAKHDVDMMVIGDTRTVRGDANEVTAEFDAFVDALTRHSDKKIVVVPEHGTTGAARAGLGEGEPRGTIQSPRGTKDTAHDARAAALILQRYLGTMGASE